MSDVGLLENSALGSSVVCGRRVGLVRGITDARTLHECARSTPALRCIHIPRTHSPLHPSPTPAPPCSPPSQGSFTRQHSSVSPPPTRRPRTTSISAGFYLETTSPSPLNGTCIISAEHSTFGAGRRCSMSALGRATWLSSLPVLPTFSSSALNHARQRWENWPFSCQPLVSAHKHTDRIRTETGPGVASFTQDLFHTVLVYVISTLRPSILRLLGHGAHHLSPLHSGHTKSVRGHSNRSVRRSNHSRVDEGACHRRYHTVPQELT